MQRQDTPNSSMRFQASAISSLITQTVFEIVYGSDLAQTLLDLSDINQNWFLVMLLFISLLCSSKTKE